MQSMIADGNRFTSENKISSQYVLVAYIQLNAESQLPFFLSRKTIRKVTIKRRYQVPSCKWVYIYWPFIAIFAFIAYLLL